MTNMRYKTNGWLIFGDPDHKGPASPELFGRGQPFLIFLFILPASLS
jgi:hypothetical protein